MNNPTQDLSQSHVPAESSASVVRAKTDETANAGTRDEQLSTILQMANGLAHQSRNALQRAGACLELLELDLEGNEGSLALTRRVRTALVELHRGYEEARQYAMPIALAVGPTDVSQLLRSAMDELSPSFLERKASVRFLQTASDPVADVDGARMKSVFKHLFDNSMAASDGRPQLELETLDGKLHDRPAIEIGIRDHGSGLEPSVRSRLFEPFVTTKQHGTGLGLAVCRRIMDAHRGTIQIANHPGGGVVATLRVARSLAHPARETEHFKSS